jgi:hypothetical protein
LQKNKERSYYLVFSTIHDVLRAERKLKEHGFNFELMPIPRNLSSDCGSCIRLYDEIEEVMECIGDIKIEKRFVHNGKDFTALA